MRGGLRIDPLPVRRRHLITEFVRAQQSDDGGLQCLRGIGGTLVNNIGRASGRQADRIVPLMIIGRR